MATILAVSSLQTNEHGRRIVVHHVNRRNQEKQEDDLEILYF